MGGFGRVSPNTHTQCYAIPYFFSYISCRTYLCIKSFRFSTLLSPLGGSLWKRVIISLSLSLYFCSTQTNFLSLPLSPRTTETVKNLMETFHLLSYFPHSPKVVFFLTHTSYPTLIPSNNSYIHKMEESVIAFTGFFMYGLFSDNKAIICFLCVTFPGLFYSI